jgi:hypothetical protein
LFVSSDAGRSLRFLFVPSSAGRVLRTLGLRAYRRAGAVAPVGDRFSFLFPQAPGTRSARLAYAPTGAPAQSHRSAAASLCLFVPSSAGRVLCTLGLRAYRRAGAVAPVGGRFALAADCLLTAGVGHISQTAQVARSWGGPLGPTGSDRDPAARAALAKRAERVPATEAKRQSGARARRQRLSIKPACRRTPGWRW